MRNLPVEEFRITSERESPNVDALGSVVSGVVQNRHITELHIDLGKSLTSYTCSICSDNTI